AISKIKFRLDRLGFEVTINEDINGLMVIIKKSKKYRIPYLNILLFFATLITMFFAPILLSFDFSYFDQPGAYQERFEFTLSLMAILLFHEFGHYLVGRRRGVFMSLPYFIPAPNIVGTFGAIIKSKSPFTNRRDLIEVGAGGPIAGFVVSVIVLCFGLQGSEIVLSGSKAGMNLIFAIGAETGLVLGDSLLIKFLSWLIIGPIPEGYDFMLSPAAFAAWVGLLVTMINLLPLGQLDGGHVIYALIGKKQRLVGRIILPIMIVMGFWWAGWWLFGAMVFMFGINHPPTINDSIKLPRHARIIGYCALFIFIISFIPVPFKMG
ncbi:MAG: site-2 protease family protein, partial [candidate division Zixibacteria bacterium]|nr:site-2 protease family protein [candidate division Zixibacteria bacterium]